MAVVHYWSKEDWDQDENHLRIEDKNSDVILKRMLSNCVPQMNSIEIETINRCNNDCSFCPVSKGNDIREYKKMSEELFHQIIDQLSDMDYRGYISLFSNNEPLLDVRIFDFLKYAKEKLPFAKHALYTNGMLLTKEKYQILVEYLDYLIIDNYDDNLEIYENIKQILEDESITDKNCYVQIDVRKKTQVLLNRGGLAPNKKDGHTFLSPCVLPFFQMIVRPDGKISRCCQDAYGNMTLADLSHETIEQAWRSRAYTVMRENMCTKGRESIRQCVACDFFGLRNYFPIEWVHEYTEAFVGLVKERQQKYDRIVVCDDRGRGEMLMQMLSLHGIYVDELQEEISQIEDDVFYICTHYDWDVLEDFQIEDIGERIIVFENPNLNLIMSKQPKKSARNKAESICVVHEAEKMNKLVLFGTGQQCKTLLSRYGWNVSYYVDNNESKLGEKFAGRIIYGPMKLLEDTETKIIITCADYKSVKKQLKEMGIDSNRIINGNVLLNLTDA